MLCDSGNCHCFHCWGNTDLNLNCSHTQAHSRKHTHTHMQTQQSKNRADSHLQFPVFMNAIDYVRRKVRRILYDTFYTQCTGPEVFSHELLFCKRVVLQTVYLSVECRQRYDVSKSEFLNENDV